MLNPVGIPENSPAIHCRVKRWSAPRPGGTLEVLIPKPIALALLFACITPLAAKTPQEMQAAGWQMTFNDEFDGLQLDQSKWVPHYTYDAIINHELQAYIPDAFTVTDGTLHITAKHEDGKQAGKTQHYTSGAMTTFGNFSQLYGYFEIRCKLPKGQGYWPAFWLLSINKEWPPEIDIFENLGHENTKLHLTNHWKDAAGKPRGKGQEANGPDFTADYHTIAVDWEPDKVTWYVDDIEQCNVTEHISNEPMYLLVNLAVGGDWPKSPNASTLFPQSYDIDYVRVYQHANAASAPAPVPASPATNPAPVQ